MLVECERCGAPLDAKNDDRLVKCRYCEAVNKVKSARTLAIQTPAAWAPPPVWQPRPDARLQHALALREVQITAAERARSSARFVGCFVIGITMIVPGMIIAGITLSSGDCSVTSPTVDDTPVLGVFRGPQVTAGMMLSGSVTPRTSASTFASGTHCTASIESAPTMVVELTAPMLIDLSTMSAADTTLIVQDAAGQFHCDDDSGGGHNARLAFGAPPGRTGIWVGAFGADTTAFQLTVSGRAIDAMPDALGLIPQGPATLGTVDLAQQHDGTVSGTISGGLDASHLGSGCRGHISVVPDLILIAPAESPFILTGDSAIDTVMVVRTATGQFLCDDDSGEGQNPRIQGALPAGANAVWIGPLSASSNPVDFRLSYTSLGEGESFVGGLAPSADPILRVVTSAEVVRPLAIEGETIDAVNAREASTNCIGFVPMAPHVRLVLESPSTLELSTRASEDLTMVVQTPDGAITCDDDSGGNRQPRVRTHFPAGTSAIWVGRYAQGAPVAFVLNVRPRR